MSSLELLKKIEHYLTDKQYECALHEATDEMPFEALIVALGVDQWGNELAAQISANQQQVSPQSPVAFYNLKMHIPLHIQIREGTYNDLSSILCFVNNNLEIGSFGFNEFEGTLHFKYNMLMQGNMLTSELVLGLLGMMLLYIDSQLPAIVHIAEGKGSYLSFLEQLSDLWREIEQR